MEHKVKFHGTGKEYFGIWIVNIILTILTIGIYSAWAKVRTNRYFYGNTYIDNHPFEYHAKPMQILIGRVIVVVALVVLNVISQVNPFFALPVFVIYIVALPWLVCRGLRFSRRVTSYRNVRFDFVGDYGGAFWALILLPLLNVFTLFLITPYTSRAIARYVGNNTRYGDRPVNVDVPVGPLYKVLAVGLTLIFIMVGFALFTAVPFFRDGLTPGALNAVSVAFIPIFMLLYVVAIVLSLIYGATLRNLTFNNMSVDAKHTFKSTVKPWSYVGVVVTNFLLVAVTLGLGAPWARVRITNYLADNTSLIAAGPLDDYTSQIRAETGVIGEEYMDVGGVDIGAAI